MARPPARFPMEIEPLRLEDEPCLAGVSPRIRAGIRIKSGLTINGQAYSRALWEHCQQTAGCCSVEWIRRKVESLADASDMGADAVVVCLGYGSSLIPELRSLAIKCVAGQSIDFVRRSDGPVNDLSCSLLAGKYIAPLRDGGRLRLHCGATQEHGNIEDLVRREADMERAKQELMPELTALYPELSTDSWVPTNPRYGIRALANRENEGRLPLCGLLTPSTSSNSDVWVFTGLGSRGLIHHALLGELMAKAVIYQDPGHLPDELQRSALFEHSGPE
mmetsp:Transcript_22562/g.50807  ORF Transcript_22562/g.50807 Transcript_22562/m.50807 type:complete len:277 (-) Transcript_22562:82-912(-)